MVRTIPFVLARQVYSRAVEIPKMAWASILVLGAGVFASAYFGKYTPLLVTILLAYALLVSSCVLYWKLTFILGELSPAESVGACAASEPQTEAAAARTPPRRHASIYTDVKGGCVDALQSADELKLFGKAYAEPAYLLLPAPDGARGIPLRQYQLFWFGQDGVEMVERVRPCSAATCNLQSCSATPYNRAALQHATYNRAAQQHAAYSHSMQRAVHAMKQTCKPNAHTAHLAACTSFAGLHRGWIERPRKVAPKRAARSY